MNILHWLNQADMGRSTGNLGDPEVEKAHFTETEVEVFMGDVEARKNILF